MDTISGEATGAFFGGEWKLIHSDVGYKSQLSSACKKCTKIDRFEHQISRKKTGLSLDAPLLGRSTYIITSPQTSPTI